MTFEASSRVCPWYEGQLSKDFQCHSVVSQQNPRHPPVEGVDRESGLMAPDRGMQENIRGTRVSQG